MVLEAIKGEKSPRQIPKACSVHESSVEIKHWLLERAPASFERAEIVREEEQRIAALEQLVGGK